MELCGSNWGLRRPVSHLPARNWSGVWQIRAVAGQRSSPELCLANKTKMLLRAKNEREHNDLTTLERQIHWNVKYRSLWPKFILRSKVILQRHSFPKVWHSSIKYYSRYKAKSLDHEKLGHSNLHFLGQRPHHIDKLSQSMMFVHQTIFNFKIYRYSKINRPWNIGHTDFHLRSNVGSYWLIIPKIDVHTWNSFQDITQNHWTMKYRSQSPTFIFKLNAGSYRLTIPKYDVHTANSLQDIMQNQWPMKYRSQWSTFILGQTSGHTD